MLALALLVAFADPPAPAPEPQPSTEPIELGGLIGTSNVLGVLLEAPRPVGGPVDASNVDVVFGDDRLTVHNGKPYPITFTLELTSARNASTTPRTPFQKVLKPGQGMAVRFSSRDGGTKAYSYRWSWSSGSYKAKHRERTLYQLPWPADQSFECTQGFDGDYSHKGEHSIDIVMPKGTPILAARAGRVISVIDGWGDGAPDRKYIEEANKVRLLHDDGTYADYVHLLAGSIPVAVGDAVEVGEKLGEAGTSGFSKRPHLHFVVRSALDGWVTRTWPVRFEIDGEAVVMGPGKWYPREPPKE
ncbi:MAG: M23 family metallopeptidase [Alphaproteobacteria bacterium]|nr:M23 family metallopeptidase [Alphaproteobacteria bacterium]